MCTVGPAGKRASTAEEHLVPVFSGFPQNLLMAAHMCLVPLGIDPSKGLQEEGVLPISLSCHCGGGRGLFQSGHRVDTYFYTRLSILTLLSMSLSF